MRKQGKNAAVSSIVLTSPDVWLDFSRRLSLLYGMFDEDFRKRPVGCSGDDRAAAVQSRS